MARKGVRAVVLCEDRKQESFIKRLFGRLGVTSVRFETAPNGEGSAEQWVRLRLPAEVVAFRRQASHQQNLALVVMTDGDALGLDGRKRSLDHELVAQGHERRGLEERIAYLIPTWSIETWLAWLSGTAALLPDLGEQTPYKINGTYQGLERDGTVSTQRAVNGWNAVDLTHERDAIPSLSDARRELDRVPRGV